MDFGAAELRAVLEDTVPAGAAGLLVGLSGGADSACLLTALCAATTVPLPWPVRAVHIDHALQAAASALRESAVRLCRQLSVPLTVVRVAVEIRPGVSVEAAARTARYRAFAHELRSGECLLTAHHAQDQAETLLLQLLRGAGLKGLSAMPLCRRFAAGWHLRPLIDVTPRALGAFRAARGIDAAADPMNCDPRFDRSYLRTGVWPALEQRWPGAAASLARTAHHLADAQQLLDQTAASTLRRLRDGEALSVSGLRALGAREQVSTLRHWLRERGITPPSTLRLAEALRQVLTADSDHLPAIVWGEHALRRYRARLFVTSACLPALGASTDWRIVPGSCLRLGEGLGTLRWVAQPGGLDAKRLPDVISVRRRSGGEALKVGERARTQSVQHLCQAMGVLPWMRDALPLLYAGDELFAIGDIWQDARWRVGERAPGFACVWEDAPMLT